jgi:hypothetical protein
MAAQAPGKGTVNRDSHNTLFVDCDRNERTRRVLSSVALSEDEAWRAYVEVSVQSGPGCLHTTRLWVARANHLYRLVYLIPPERYLAENGMEILGWARNCFVVGRGSDAGPSHRASVSEGTGTGLKRLMRFLSQPIMWPGSCNENEQIGKNHADGITPRERLAPELVGYTDIPKTLLYLEVLRSRLLQFRVFRLGLLQHGDITIGTFP